MSGGEGTAAGVSMTPATSLKLAAVYASVRVISEDVASLPLLTYRRLERGKERATEHPLYRLLHDEPNPFMTSMQFRETLQGHVLTWGNGYASIERDRRGQPNALWPLRPDCMDAPVVSEANTLLYTYHLPSGEPRALTQGEVFHLRGLSPDGLVGYSPISLHRNALGLAWATMEYGSRFFGNDSRPGGVLQAPQRLSNDAAERMKMSWEQAHRGLSNAHRVAVLEEGVEWRQVGIPPEDSQWLQTREFQMQEVARIFRMPPHKIQDLSRATFSNIESQAIQYVSDTLRPWLVRWEQQINKDLLMPRDRGRIFCEHLMDALLRGETLSRFQAYQLGLQNGVYSANDVRAMENLNPFDGGDTFLQMANMIPYGTKPQPVAPKPEPEAVA
jgi:HK97 family phage portal protein